MSDSISNNDNFYSELPVYDGFASVSRLDCYSPLPDDWLIVVADVQDSTGAIEAGQYKAVNIVGVSVITALRNMARPIALPYVFGGDGACLCIPPSLLAQAEVSLLATRAMAKVQFGLNLRVGIIPVEKVMQEGYTVLLLRHLMSMHYIQAAFAGGCVEYA